MVLLVLGSVAHIFAEETPTVKEFKHGTKNVLRRVKVQKSGDLAFALSNFEFAKYKDTLLKVSGKIVNAQHEWERALKTEDTLQEKQAVKLLFDARIEFKNILWTNIFKFKENMRVLSISNTDPSNPKSENLLNEYLVFITTFDMYCCERLHPKFGLRTALVGNKPGIQF
jgi:hypothetical protein